MTEESGGAAAGAPARSTWTRRLVRIAGPVALAGAMLMYFGGRSGPSGEPVPVYEVTANGARATSGAVALRVGGEAARAGARYELVLRPSAPPQGTVVAYAFTVGAGGAEVVPLDATIELRQGGEIYVGGRARTLDGAREVRIVVGAPANIGKFDDATARAKQGASDAYVGVLNVPIERD